MHWSAIYVMTYARDVRNMALEVDDDTLYGITSRSIGGLPPSGSRGKAWWQILRCRSIGSHAASPTLGDA